MAATRAPALKTGPGAAGARAARKEKADPGKTPRRLLDPLRIQF
jgi:hypothetical protein